MNPSPNWITWFLIIWALAFGFAIVPRLLRLKGKPGGLVEPRAGDIVFDESYASARSHKSTYTKYGGGSRCMHISVTKHALLVRPHFPFSIVGADLDLVHEIPLSTISSVTAASVGSLSGIAVHFGEGRRLDLVLKRSSEFQKAISSSL